MYGYMEPDLLSYFNFGCRMFFLLSLKVIGKRTFIFQLFINLI